MRKLKLDENEILHLLDTLDVQEFEESQRGTKYSYRVRNLRLDVQDSPTSTTTYSVAARVLRRDSLTFLCSNLISVGRACLIHLITIRNNWHTVAGRVTACRYVPGSAGIHEATVSFTQTIDPSSFVPNALRARVLLVDDSAMSRRLLKHILTDMNLEVTSVENGLEALKLAHRESYDLILMDVEMPELDGLSAVRILRRQGYVRPIVAISSLTNPSLRQNCLEAGCDDFLEKPIPRTALDAVFRYTRVEPLVSSMIDDGKMHALIDEFVVELPDRMRQIESLFGSNDTEAMMFELRKLKGEAGGFGFEPISQAAERVESAIHDELPYTEIRQKLVEFLRMCHAARPATYVVAAEVDDDPDEMDPTLEPTIDDQEERTKAAG